MKRVIVRHAYAPFMLLGVNGCALWIVSGGGLGGWLLVLLAFAVVVSFAAERLLPYEREWNRARGDGLRDGVHALVNELASFGMLLVLPATTSLLAMEGVWPAGWPLGLQLILAIAVLDVGIALAHFLSHRAELLWRFHAVHHSVTRMYGVNGLVKHPVHLFIETFAGTAPLILMGLPENVASLLVFCVAVQLLLQHSNADYSVGVLRNVLAVAEVHRFHHRKDPAQGDVNFGLFTTLVDRVLGTFYYEAGEILSSDQLGIADEPDYPTPYLSQLVEPFRRRALGASGGVPI